MPTSTRIQLVAIVAGAERRHLVEAFLGHVGVCCGFEGALVAGAGALLASIGDAANGEHHDHRQDPEDHDDHEDLHDREASVGSGSGAFRSRQLHRRQRCGHESRSAQGTVARCDGKTTKTPPEGGVFDQVVATGSSVTNQAHAPTATGVGSSPAAVASTTVKFAGASFEHRRGVVQASRTSVADADELVARRTGSRCSWA